jgi:tetratricopeptide (TPR) repeat protein
MYTITKLLATAYQRWNDAQELGSIGMELETRSRLEEARHLLGRALELDPVSHPEWYLSLAFAHFRDVGSLSAEGERILIDGIEETDSDFLKAAYLSVLEADGGSQAMIDDLIAYLRESDDVSVRFALGYSLLWRGDSEAAIDLLRQSVALLEEHDVPLGLDLYCGALNWMYAQHMPALSVDLATEVAPYLERMINQKPQVYNYRALKIQMYQTLRSYAAVVETARQTLSLFPDEETTMVALASALEKLGDDEQAVLWYNRAIGAKPSFARARVMLSKLYERRGNTTLAESVLREIPTAFPEYTLGRLEIAYFLYRHGKTDEALSLFQYGYDRLKTFEKSAVEQHPEGALLLEELNRFMLPVV